MRNDRNTTQFDDNPTGWLTLPELRERALGAVAASPRTAALAVRRLIGDPEGRRRFAEAVSLIGTEYARRVFDFLAPQDWAGIEASAGTEAPLSSLSALLRELDDERAAWEAHGDPEEAHLRLQDAIRRDAPELAREDDPAKIAVLSCLLSPHELMTLLDRFPSGFRREVIVQTVRMERLPREAIRGAALRFALSLPEPAEIVLELEKLPEPAPKPVAGPAQASEAAATLRRAIDLSADSKVFDFLRHERPELYRQLQSAGTIGSSARIAELLERLPAFTA